MTTPKALDASEFDTLNQWFLSHSDSLPEPIRILQKRLLDTYGNLTTSKKQQKKLLAEMNRLMGLIASSESGSREKNPFGLR